MFSYCAIWMLNVGSLMDVFYRRCLVIVLLVVMIHVLIPSSNIF